MRGDARNRVASSVFYLAGAFPHFGIRERFPPLQKDHKESVVSPMFPCA
jgi:hypothetical protein